MLKKLNFNFFKRQKSKDSKLTLSELVWFGFNYTVGITFTAVFAQLLFAEKNSLNLGTHMIWIFLVEGLIAGTCAWAFSRLSRVHPGNNGAAYIYVRSSYGRFWGWIIAFVQYSTLPVIVTSQIISMIRINFTDSSSFLYANWGIWTNLGLDLIGIVIYALASCVLFLGIKAWKRFVNISSYLKWGTTGLLMIAVIILFIMAGTSNYTNVINHQSLTANSFSKAFTACFFFFLGFETYATIGKNVKNPQKNIGRSIIIVMVLSTLFYVTVIALMIGAISTGFENNPNLQIFHVLGMNLNAAWLGKIGIIIMLICTISLKANAGMQNALYSGGILEPLSVEGYIPEKYKELNADKIPFRASILNLVVTFIFAIVWLIIPDIIQALIDSTQPVIIYGTITGEASLIMILIYICVISIALKLSIQKKLRHNKFELTIWTFAFLFLVWQLGMWIYGLVQGFQTAFTDMNTNTLAGSDFKTLAERHSAGVIELVSNILQMAYILIVIAFAIIWYYAYYRPKLQHRLTNQTQSILDADFIVKDDWAFVAKNMQSEIENYLDRNVRIYGDKNNNNYDLAKKVRAELLLSEGEWREAEDSPDEIPTK